MMKVSVSVSFLAATLLCTSASAFADVPSDDEDDACECRAAGRPVQGGELAAGLLLGGFVLGRERRRRR